MAAPASRGSDQAAIAGEYDVRAGANGLVTIEDDPPFLRAKRG